MFGSVTRTLVTSATAAVLSFGVASAVQADDTVNGGPCATQEAQVAKAEAALERVTAVHANHAKDDAKAKKAQLQRLAKAEARLAKCVAAQPA
jgi:Tfp pilus assembly protein PilF